MNEPRTVVVPTIDHGDVTIICPEWCTGEHEPNGYRVDITHTGRDHHLTLPVHTAYAELLAVGIEERPFSEAWPGRAPFVSVGFNGDHYPTGVYGLEVMAGHLERHAEALREFARQLAAIVAGGEGR
ncbi:DUF6907 domain-containing protein [Streptomyces sp. bgisy034]|uniref:DUF6907 domain-containing protein n=1 Tax=Streptomyces sp. bgisy034 TaxID=3413774 RepID=UPI003EBFB63A